MGDFSSNHTDGIDHPLAHDAGVNHTIHSVFQPQNHRTANFISRRVIGDALTDAEVSQTSHTTTEHTH